MKAAAQQSKRPKYPARHKLDKTGVKLGQPTKSMKTVGLILIVLAVLYVLRSFISAAKNQRSRAINTRSMTAISTHTVRRKGHSRSGGRRTSRALGARKRRREQKRVWIYLTKNFKYYSKAQICSMQERKSSYIDPYGNITDTGRGLNSSEEETGVGYFIEKA